MKHKFPIFNHVPDEAIALVEAARSQPARLEFTSRGADTEMSEDGFKQYAREVVAADEANGFKMSLDTFLKLWAKA